MWESVTNTITRARSSVGETVGRYVSDWGGTWPSMRDQERALKSKGWEGTPDQRALSTLEIARDRNDRIEMQTQAWNHLRSLARLGPHIGKPVRCAAREWSNQHV